MDKILNVILVLILCSSCYQNQLQKQINKEVEQLNTIEKQRQYLIDIYRLDQEVRKDEKRMVESHGLDRPEHRNSFHTMDKADKTNLLKVEYYLKKYGHPSKKTHGQDACSAPWIVIHHSGSDTAPRRRNFKYIYRAFKNGDIDDGAITFYLNRMYQIKFGQRIKWNRPYRVEEELDTLYRALSLQSIINKENSSAY